ncbi:MAG: hypothetical protein HYY65_04145 [Candidatus Tectomicrobia bacterium]|uniref:Uncharacterized protein n=1 Tax=Tectimicrobiota bacterium TaxID=2528274 RepID=A0A932M0V0_UNCTE|nr:hypothetical protein [Candidatus Tectomicrobia bacterium]
MQQVLTNSASRSSAASGSTHPALPTAILGGFNGTAVMTMMMYFVAPMMLGRPMDVAAMLGSVLGGSWLLGMLMHFINGSIIFPLVYVYAAYRLLPGASWMRGTLLGLVLWFLSQAAVTPMMGGGFFSANSGGLMAVMASLLAHAVYGALLGGFAGGAE